MDRHAGIRALPEGQHRQLLKIFALAATCAVVAILSLAGFGLDRLIHTYILDEAEDDAVHLSRVLLQHGLEKYLETGGTGGGSGIMSAEMDRTITARLDNFDILKIKIFSSDRRILYSNDRGIVGVVDARNHGLDQALRGETFSKLKKKESPSDLETENKIGFDAVETYIPVRDEVGNVIGAFELYMDVSRYRQDQKKIVSGALGVLSVILVVVFGILFLLMRSATRLLYARTQEVKILSGLLPICSYCKKIRNDEQEWESLEEYISARSESEFTHSLCPDCLKTYWPG